MKIALKTYDGHYLCAEDGGGTTLNATRTKVGEWEEFEFEDRGQGVFALRTSNGHYLGVDPEFGDVTADRPQVGEWEEWAAIPGPEQGSVAIQSVYTSLFLQAVEGGGGEVRCVVDHDFISVWESFWPSVDILHSKQEVLPTEAAPADPDGPLRLVGPLKVVNKTFEDDNGPVFPFFCSDFSMMAVARRDREAAARRMERIATKYPGFRTFLQVGGWTPYWDGLEVNLVTFNKWFFDANNGGHTRPAALGRGVAAWPLDEYADTLRFVLRKCTALGIRVEITFGDMQIICPDYGKELHIHEQISRIVQEEGGTKVAVMVEGANEFPINHRGGDSPESMEQLGKILDVWRRNVPGILTAMGAIINDNKLELSGLYGNVNAVHNDRDPVETHLKHAFGTVYWEGQWRHLEDGVWFTEPVGPGKDSFQANADPANLVAVYMLHGLLGCGSCLFEGPAVRDTEELDSVWGFNELPVIAHQLLPRDVHLWDRKTNSREGGVMYWCKGKEFRAIVITPWNPAPPMEIESWSLHQGTGIKTGTGNPPKGMTGLLYGKFK